MATVLCCTLSLEHRFVLAARAYAFGVASFPDFSLGTSLWLDTVMSAKRPRLSTNEEAGGDAGEQGLH